MQRLRIKFSREEEIKYISHLDIIRLWHRAFVRARIPLSHSEGFNPRPRISLAVPLSVGVTSESELMDVFLKRPVSPHYFNDAVSQQLPGGSRIFAVSQVGPHLPSLQSLARMAEYTVTVHSEGSRDDVQEALRSLLARQSLPWQHQRDTGPRSYDLRALIDDLWIIDCGGSSCFLGMRLHCGSKGSGRPEQVTAALGFSDFPLSVHRTKIILSAR